MTGICDGRVAIVTGAGRGIGREHALELARQGARVVVNDLGVANDGRGSGGSPADEVVAEIRAFGGEAIASGEDVADFEATGALVRETVARWGRLDVVVNNAGFVRDKMFVNSSVDDWDAVLRVHLRGHFCIARHAAAHWRDRSKAGERDGGRIINTTSGAGLLGSVGQSAYATAKAGIVGLTLVQAAELGRYGVTANAIAPAARTRMTEGPFAEAMKKPSEGFDAMDPANVAPIVAWLASAEGAAVTGQVFEVSAGVIAIAEGFHEGPRVDRGERWSPAAVGPAVRDLLARARPAGKVYGAP